MKPKIGQIVIYNHSDSAFGKFPLTQSPAIIQKVIPDNGIDEDSRVFLWVFGPQGIFYSTCEPGDGPCQWNWPKMQSNA